MRQVDEPGTLRLTRIRVYPLKGVAGLDLEETELDAFGIPGDRRWMLVRPDGRFLSQRTHPRLCLLRTAARNEGSSGASRGEGEAATEGKAVGGGVAVDSGQSFTVAASGMEPLPLEPFSPRHRWLEVQVHADRFSALEGDDEANRWFSAFLGEACRLVHIPESVTRPVDPEVAPGHRLSFADGYPLHLTAVESLRALNRELREPMSMLRFRPNLVVQGGGAWEEDEWRRLQVGGVPLELVKPCARCTVTTVDPETGTPGQEPLKTLRGFREWGGRIYFGQNAVFQRQGRIRMGDPVRILGTGRLRPPLSGPEGPDTLGETILRGSGMEGKEALEKRP